MPRFFVKTDQINNNSIKIIGEDVKHIKNVLRKQKGDNLEICNQENGKVYICKIEKIEEYAIINTIISELENQADKVKIDIYQGLPKSDKMELIIQKSVELGVNTIIPVEMKRCVVKLESRDIPKKIERWQKIAESAAKQSGRNEIPKIEYVKTIQDIINSKKQYHIIITAYENEKENTLKKELLELKKEFSKNDQINIAIIIGPEGGLESTEVEYLKQNGAKIVTLGPRILRTETVALNMLSIIRYELEM